MKTGVVPGLVCDVHPSRFPIAGSPGDRRNARATTPASAVSQVGECDGKQIGVGRNSSAHHHVVPLTVGSVEKPFTRSGCTQGISSEGITKRCTDRVLENRWGQGWWCRSRRLGQYRGGNNPIQFDR